METILLVIHLLIAIALIAVVLVQKSEGGGLGIGSGTAGGMVTARGGANLLSRTTAILAALFMGMALLQAILAGTHSDQRSIIDELEQAPAGEQSAPAEPQVPTSQ
ncbi:MAG: preprotein translocase subunit SecG [Alphaproteobacteria bacterium]|nr:preprotein translocase subunit SecG [Alphaproteobacteria bacterium]